MSSRLTAALALLVATACGSATPARDRPDKMSGDDKALLDDVQKRTFDWFWETTNPKNGLTPDRWPSQQFSSIAANGFALTAWPVGVEHGWITRAQAVERTLTTLRFFRDAPQGTAATGMSGYRGFYYHFLDMQTGTRFGESELSSVDTAELLAGVLFAREYFDRPEEQELRDIADGLLARADWRWMQPRKPAISMGWDPRRGFLEHDWLGYNEAMIAIILALGSPTFAVDADAWTKWTEPYDKTFGVHYGQEHLGFQPHFGHHFTHVWVDFRGIRDPYMRSKGIDYFENSRRATYTQRAYAIANPDGWKDYGQNIWGLTACDGPGDFVRMYDGKQRTFRGYVARGWGINDDGTVAPTAAVASIPFAPEIAIPATRAMRDRYGARLYQKYGFLDSFNPSLDWFNKEYIGIDQGPILLLIENYRTDLIWKTMRKSEYLRRALRKAGFTGGWLEAAQ
jgi:hypothetical protein